MKIECQIGFDGIQDECDKFVKMWGRSKTVSDRATVMAAATIYFQNCAKSCENFGGILRDAAVRNLQEEMRA